MTSHTKREMPEEQQGSAPITGATAPSPAAPKTPAQVLREAAGCIKRRGWRQGGYASPNGAVCMLGAIRTVLCGSPYAVPKPDSDDSDGSDIYDDVQTVLEHEVSGIVRFNDTPGRTVDEVIAALLAAADKCDRASAPNPSAPEAKP